MSTSDHKSTDTVRITIPARSAGSKKRCGDPRGKTFSGSAATNLDGSASEDQHLLENIYDALVIASGLSGRIGRVNERAVALFGYDREQFSRLSLAELVSGAGASLMAQISTKATAGSFVIIEAYCVRSDDSEFPAEIALHITGSGVEQRVYVFIRDISRRIQMERELLRLSKATNSTGDGIAIIDENGHFVYHNAALKELLGQEESDDDPGDWLRKQSTPELQEALTRHISWSGNIELQLRQAENSIPARVRVDPIRLDDDRIIGMVVIVTDITQQRRTEEQLRRALTELARSNAELEQIAYVASHDLKEPLRVIAGYMDLLQRRYGDQLDDQASDYVHKAVTGAQQMRDLINHMLDYARLDRPSGPLTQVHAGALIHQAQENLRSLIRERHAVITCDPLPTIITAPARLVQVFQNLISNALHYCEQDIPRIHIRASREEDQWVFRVADNGVGIPKEMTERVFILFQRLHTRDEVAGSGIGLATCKKIVERFGGRIWIESNAPEPGSTFAFSLPVTPPEPDDQADIKPPPGLISDP